MKYIIIILFGLLVSCQPGIQLYKTYKIEDSQGSLEVIRSELIDLQIHGTIKGIITDQSTQEKIVGATIILHNKKTLIGTVTDYDGKFQLKSIPYGSYRIIASLVGYHSYIDTLSILANESKTLAIELLESPVVIGDN